MRKKLWLRRCAHSLLGLTLAAGALQAQDTLPPVDVTAPRRTPDTTIPGSPTDNMPTPPPDATARTGAPIAAGGLFASPVVNGYLGNSSTTGTIFNVPQLDFPGAVSVVPEAVIRDQQAFEFNSIIRDISGANKLGDFRRPDALLLRGFEVRRNDYRWNGFLDPTSAPRDLANVQRIEVLKGPASVLYGAGQPAGVVNVITKKAQSDGLMNYDVFGGSFGMFRTTIDADGAASQQGRLLLRVNAAYETSDGFRDFSFNERNLVAPVATYLIDDDTAILFEAQYLNDRRRFDSGVVAVNGQVGLMPISTFYNQPTDFNRYNDYKTMIKLVHDFGNDWGFELGGYAGWYDTPSFGTVPVFLGSPSPFIPVPPDTLLRQVQDNFAFREQYYSIIGNLAGKVQTGPFVHRTLIGMELGWFRSTDFTTALSDPLQPIQTPFAPFPIPFPSSPINVFNPTYAGTTPPLVGSFNSDYTQNRYGFYAQDLIDLNRKWKLMAGVRADIATTTFNRELNNPFAGFDVGFPETNTDANYYRWSPRVGLVYQPIEEVLSFYTSYSRSFDPPPGGAFRNAAPLLPETGRSVEGGMKMDLLDRQLQLIISGFYIQKENVTTQDSIFFATQLGQQRSQGVEMSAIGNITQYWSILSNYAYIDSQITDDLNPLIQGNRFRGVPYNTMNIWSRWNLIDNRVHTVGMAIGLVALSDREGDLQNSFELPGYTRWDAGFFFRRNALNAALYLENLFDREYYAGSLDALSVFPGAPFTLRANVGVRF